MPQYVLMDTVLLPYSGIISLRLMSKVLNVTGVGEGNQTYVLFVFLFTFMRSYKWEN